MSRAHRGTGVPRGSGAQPHSHAHAEFATSPFQPLFDLLEHPLAPVGVIVLLLVGYALSLWFRSSRKKGYESQMYWDVRYGLEKKAAAKASKPGPAGFEWYGVVAPSAAEQALGGDGSDERENAQRLGAIVEEVTEDDSSPPSAAASTSSSKKKTATTQRPQGLTQRRGNTVAAPPRDDDEIITRVRAAIAQPATVLELGCGSSLLGESLARAGYGVVSTDFSSVCIEERRRTQPAALRGAHRYVCADARDMRQTFPSASIDGIVEKATLDSIVYSGDSAAQDRAERVRGELVRVLRPGGVLVSVSIANPEKWRSYWDSPRHLRLRSADKIVRASPDGRSAMNVYIYVYERL